MLIGIVEMTLEEKMLKELKQWWDTDHTIKDDKEKLCKESVMVLRGVIRGAVIFKYKGKLQKIQEAIRNPQYGTHGVEIDTIREELIKEFITELGYDSE